MQKKGTLFVLSTPIGGSVGSSLPNDVLNQIRNLDYFIAERAKSCRQFLKDINHPKPLQEIEVAELDKHNPMGWLEEMLQPIKKGRNAGLVSEAGAAGVLDPGTEIVSRCQEIGIPVVPLVGPSSIILALMASGLGGQQFQVVGYLSPKQHELRNQLKRLEKESSRKKVTQICIETPYRNLKLFDAFCRYLEGSTFLCVASGMTTKEEFILTKRINQWKKLPAPLINKVPTVFIFLSEPE